MKIVFATANAHKLAEARQILGPAYELSTPADHGITEDIPEPEATLTGNALSKARYVHERTGLDCFADDTGLEVEALGGAPGVFSARYAEKESEEGRPGRTDTKPRAVELALTAEARRRKAEPEARSPQPASHDSAANMALLLRNMEGVENRRARFRTVIALVLGGKEHTFEGEVRGAITTTPSGAEGFGYDPVFIPDGYDVTFAEMPASEKNAISHRARALRQLAAFLNTLA